MMVIISNPNIILHIILGGTPAFVNMIPKAKANTTPNMAKSCVYTPNIPTIYFGDSSLM